MKTADELFFEMGYIKYDNHPEHDLPPEPNMFSTQDIRQLYYEQRGIVKGMPVVQHIEFDLIKKVVVCYVMINAIYTVVPLNMQELQAINKKCEELKWI